MWIVKRWRKLKPGFGLYIDGKLPRPISVREISISKTVLANPYQISRRRGAVDPFCPARDPERQWWCHGGLRAACVPLFHTPDFSIPFGWPGRDIIDICNPQKFGWWLALSRTTRFSIRTSTFLGPFPSQFRVTCHPSHIPSINFLLLSIVLARFP